jgi:hypothetical protein
MLSPTLMVTNIGRQIMSDEKAFSGSILRVFEARAKPGCADSLAEKFATTSVDVVRNQPGNQGYFFGKSVSDEDDVLLFVSVWRDLEWWLLGPAKNSPMRETASRCLPWMAALPSRSEYPIGWAQWTTSGSQEPL